ncbi:acyl-CoA thioesterase [Brevibacillus composti]|uniref:Acyl-CoA thioesterase n=1 Tax=Brevibacillus composti TaxID=2796470 RepID=A0A7T5EJ10_9BACL|nr:thioesterase family protein [Brevibacillus composti]QQE73537.1 acyl-CoA thioesterase [Brevibacillus composti]QUO40619.1 acyl-CoA thioesterase [Brevibacillus composti]
MKQDVYAHQIRVRYSETDQMGVVYHANYLNWFEVGRTEFIRDTGITYRALEEKGILLPVTDVGLSYKLPARYDDWVEIRTRLEELSPVRLTFAYELYRREDGQLLVSGWSKHAFTTTEMKPIRLSRAVPEVYALLQERCTRGRS